MKKQAIATEIRAQYYDVFAARDCREAIAKSRNRNRCDEEFWRDEAVKHARKAFRAVMPRGARALDLRTTTSTECDHLWCVCHLRVAS